MAEDANRPIVLRTVPTEAQAGMLVAALDEHGVPAWTVGGITSGLRAGAPGTVQILVRHSDLERAQEALRIIEERTDGE